MPFFDTTLLAAPGLGIIATAIMLGFGLWWLGRAEAAARRRGEYYGRAAGVPVDAAADDQNVRAPRPHANSTPPRSTTAGPAVSRRR